MRALVARTGGWLPHGWGDAGRQLGLFVLADLCYETVRGIAEGQRAEAFANAAWVIDVESRDRHVLRAGPAGGAARTTSGSIDLANFAYMNTHFVLTTGFLVWLYLYRNEHFYFVRNMFMVAMGLALVGYALVPTAPPRLIDGYGFVDTINQIRAGEPRLGAGQDVRQPLRGDP